MSSAEMYPDRAAYLIKTKPGGDFQPVSYSRLKSDINALGTALLAEGLGGAKIAVIGENRYEWIVTYFAVVCGVGVIVPIDRELTAEEIANLCTRADVSAVVYSRKLEKLVHEAIGNVSRVETVISMDALENDPEGACYSFKKLIEEGLTRLGDGDHAYTEAVVDQDVLATLLFTSGTTGLAKGVMLSHANIVSNVVNMSKFVNLAGLTGLSVLPMHHTYEFTCFILTAIYQGCTIAIGEGIKYIVKNLAESKANVVLAVPLMFEKMHRRIWKSVKDSGKAGTLKRAVEISKRVGMSDLLKKRIFKSIHKALGGYMTFMIAGGAPIDPLVIEDFNAMGIPMIQGYGTTECAPIIALNKDRYHKPASVGLPLPEMEIRIEGADAEGVGEVVCRGPSVMLGYYDDEAETAKVLKDGWFFTGDLGYIDRDGFLYLTGRKKNVIVTKNGKNIYPEEVEYYLLRSPYIEESVVWGKDDPATGDTLISADIFPDAAYLQEKNRDLYDRLRSGDGRLRETAGIELRKILDTEIDRANAQMPTFKRVKRLFVREEEFAKTTTKKIKRHEVLHHV
jgi:long-chain acyl-CoA synthetase